MSESITRQAAGNGDEGHCETDKSANCVTLHMPAEKLKNLLNPNEGGDLASVVRRARRLGELTEVLTAALPADERPGILAANLRDDGQLVVLCPSSAWASRLRYRADALLEAANAAGVDATACRVRVATK